MTSGLIGMEEALHTLKPTERKAAEYILEHPHEVLSLSVQRLAELAQVSEATIVRLARSLHLKGFQELKLRIAADLAKPVQSGEAYQDIQIDSPFSDLVESISHNNIRSIQDTLAVLSAEEMEKAVQELAGARKIVVFGVGASAVIAQDFKLKLMRINKWCEAGYDFDAQATLAANMTPSDVAFGISYSGQTESVIQSMQIAKEAGARLISLTKFGHNPVADSADIRLFISSLEKSIRSGAMASRIAQLNVIDILYVGIARLEYEESLQSLERTRQAVKASKRDG